MCADMTAVVRYASQREVYSNTRNESIDLPKRERDLNVTYVVVCGGMYDTEVACKMHVKTCEGESETGNGSECGKCGKQMSKSTLSFDCLI